MARGGALLGLVLLLLAMTPGTLCDSGTAWTKRSKHSAAKGSENGRPWSRWMRKAVKATGHVHEEREIGNPSASQARTRKSWKQKVTQLEGGFAVITSHGDVVNPPRALVTTFANQSGGEDVVAIPGQGMWSEGERWRGSESMWGNGQPTLSQEEREVSCRNRPACKCYCHGTGSHEWECLRYTRCPSLTLDRNGSNVASYSCYAKCTQPAEAAPAGGGEVEWTLADGECFKFVPTYYAGYYKDGLTHSQAEAICFGMGAQLGTIRAQAQNQAVASMVGNWSEVHNGLTIDEQSSRVAWQSGNPVIVQADYWHKPECTECGVQHQSAA